MNIEVYYKIRRIADDVFDLIFKVIVLSNYETAALVAFLEQTEEMMKVEIMKRNERRGALNEK